MKRVLLVNDAVYLPGEGGYKRTMYLFNMMREIGYEVTLLTGDFNHYSKKKRDVEKFRKEYPEYNENIIILKKIPYKKNISLVRYFSDRDFAYKEAKWVLDNKEKYDVVLLDMPDIDAILKTKSALKGTNKAIVVDIRDLHPEALRVVFKNPMIYNILTYRMKKRADRAYACADEFVAVSQEYLDRGLRCNNKSKHSEVVYLGSALEVFDQGIEKLSHIINKPIGEFWITYIGTIGASYDFKTIIEAMAKIKNIHPDVRFKILGQGPEEERHKSYAKQIGADNVDFLGFMNYQEMAAFLSKTDITVNNIKKKASQSIINKVSDYFASGKPMLNSCINNEMQWLIDYYKTGLNYEAENINDFIAKFEILYDDAEMRKKMGINARKLALEKFDRKKCYKKIIEVIENVANGDRQ